MDVVMFSLMAGAFTIAVVSSFVIFKSVHED